MSAATTEPRRFKLASELDDDERAATRQFGRGGRRYERDEYVKWRRDTLRSERDDLALRERLLRESAEVLRNRAGDREMDAREQMSIQDWSERTKARRPGEDAPPVPGAERAQPLRAEADQMVAEANEIAQELAEQRAGEGTVEDHIERGGKR